MSYAAKSTPSPLAYGLGVAGLLPFLAGAAVIMFGVGTTLPTWVPQGMVFYGALIASFLGGIHWGLAMLPSKSAGLHLVWGVVPSLVAWPALLLPLHLALLLIAGVLLACYAVDRAVYPTLGLRPWLGLRSLLTTVAVGCCAAGSWAAWVPSV